MNKLSSLFCLCILFFMKGLYSQNVGINTTTPTHSLHIQPTGTTDPIRIEGLTLHQSNDTMLLVTDRSSGIIRAISYQDISGALQNRIDTDIDSVQFKNDTLYIYEDNSEIKAHIPLNTSLVDSILFHQYDSIYNFIKDTITHDSIFISALDSLLTTYGDTIFFNDTTYKLIMDSLLKDTTWLNQLADSVDSDVDSLNLMSDTAISLYENGKTVHLNLSPLLDSIYQKEPWKNVSDSTFASDTSTKIFFDGYVGISNTNPARELDIKGGIRSTRNLNTNWQGRIDWNGRDFTIEDAYSLGNGGSARLNFKRSRGAGDVTLPADVQQNDGLGSIFWRGYNSGSYHASALISSEVEVIHPNNRVGGDIRFYTLEELGSSSSGSEHMRITNNGNIGIATSSPQEKLHVNAENDSLQFENLAGTGNILQINANGKVFKGNGGVKITDSVATQGTDTLHGVRDYSTTEVWTGQKWIDGKKIYRIVIPFTEATLVGGEDLVHNLNVDKYIKQFFLSPGNSDTPNFFTPQDLFDSGHLTGLIYNPEANLIIIEGFDDLVGGAAQWNCILEYTKN